MGEYAEDVLEGLRDQETGEIIDGTAPGHPRSKARATRDMPCIVPGCNKKFRPTTQYDDFLAHYQQRHAPLPRSGS